MNDAMTNLNGDSGELVVAKAIADTLHACGVFKKPHGDPWTDGPCILAARAVLDATLPSHSESDVELVAKAIRQSRFERNGRGKAYDPEIPLHETELADARAALTASNHAELSERAARADLSRVAYARALSKMRNMLIAVHDELEDEGDRVYLGSSNHAELIHDAWHLADALNWDEILEDTQPKTTLAQINLKLQAERAELSERVTKLREALAWFVQREKSILNDVSSAHSGRGAGASEWMREDDRDFREALRTAFDKARALLTDGDVK